MTPFLAACAEMAAWSAALLIAALLVNRRPHS